MHTEQELTQLLYFVAKHGCQNILLSRKSLKYCIPIKSPGDFKIAFHRIRVKKKKKKKEDRTSGLVPSQLLIYFYIDRTGTLNCLAENIPDNPTVRKRQNNSKLRLKI